jgi:2-polyprenyl-3-methyl-5-hydroxy-6-metoxy-1,4-benzoquinol methylase
MTIEHAKELAECLCCGSKNLSMTLDLGHQPMANSFIETENESELKFPLRLNLCRDCFHLQLSHAVDPDLLFKNYLYVSGTTKTLREYFEWFADLTIGKFATKPNAVLEIACNDGTQLDVYKTRGMKTYGVDPATNLHELSSKQHEVICDYFGPQHVEQFKNKNIDIISAQNVLAHNSYPLDFLKYCKEIMNDQTLLFVQTSQADMIVNNEFDTVYHEHISFFSVHSMKALADRAGLYLIDVVKTPIHGNSLLFVFSKILQENNVEQILLDERNLGLQTPATYIKYARNAEQIVNDLRDTIGAYRAAGFVIAGYGAAAKGMTLLNFGGIHLDFIIDDNPLKQGRFTPGTHDPVVGIEMLDECKDLNIAFVPLAWNFFDEIKTKIKVKRDNADDVYVRYFPTISVE